MFRRQIAAGSPIWWPGSVVEYFFEYIFINRACSAKIGYCQSTVARNKDRQRPRAFFGMMKLLLEHINVILPAGALLLLAAVFSCSETAIFSLTRTDLLYFRKSQSRREVTVARLREMGRPLLIVILLFNMACTTLVFILSSVLLATIARRSGGAVALACAPAPLLLVAYAGEVMPKMIGRTFNRSLAPVLGTFLLPLVQTLLPAVAVLQKLVILPAARLIGRPQSPEGLSLGELRELLALSQTEGMIDVGENQLIERVLRLGELRVRHVMVPRVNMVSFDIARPIEELRELFLRTHLSKIPVFDRQIDNILGVVYAKELLLEKPTTTAALKALLKPVQFVPELQTVGRLLNTFRDNHIQMAISVDEFGGVAGLVSIEDVVEQLIGDISEPGDPVSDRLEPAGPDEWTASGDVSLLDCAELLSGRNASRRAATLGGLIYAELGRVPRPGDSVRLPNVRLTVETMRGPRVGRVRISLADKAETLSGADHLPPDADSVSDGHQPGGGQ